WLFLILDFTSGEHDGKENIGSTTGSFSGQKKGCFSRQEKGFSCHGQKSRRRREKRRSRASQKGACCRTASSTTTRHCSVVPSPRGLKGLASPQSTTSVSPNRPS